MRTEHKDAIKKMMKIDKFSRWLGIEIVESGADYVKLSMRVREEMVNGFGICHGGVIFSLADSAMAFSSNVRGFISLSLENNINYTKKAEVGDVLVAETEEIQNGRTIGVYKVKISNSKNEIVADFRGTVYRTGKHE